jgi:hypothetical protein
VPRLRSAFKQALAMSIELSLLGLVSGAGEMAELAQVE